MQPIDLQGFMCNAHFVKLLPRQLTHGDFYALVAWRQHFIAEKIRRWSKTHRTRVSGEWVAQRPSAETPEGMRRANARSSVQRVTAERVYGGADKA